MLVFPENASQICHDTFGYNPKLEQLDVVRKIALGRDCILVAGTGWGKTLVYFLPLELWKDRITLIITPLRVLGDEQQQKLAALNISSINVKEGEAVSVDELAAGKYRAVFMSPEVIFKSRRLEKLWDNKEWRKRLMVVVVDEAHCVVVWGNDFRKDYGQLGRLRFMVPSHIPFLAVSATMQPTLLHSAIKLLGFNENNIDIINVGNDRTNVKYVVARMKHPASSFQDLHFLKDLLKTIVYFQSRNAVELAAVYLRGLVGKENVLVYHAFKSEEYKSVNMDAFRGNSAPILLATEAAGMGCDISNVLRVVQFGFPDSISSMVQRLGRAARDPQLYGVGILLAPKTIPPSIGDDLRCYVESPACRRKYLDTVFKNTHQDNTNCCDVCHPNPKDVPIIESVANPELKTNKRKAASRSADEKLLVNEAIILWRDKTFELHYQPFMFMTKDCLMTDAMSKKIADKSASMTTPLSISEVSGWQCPKTDMLEELSLIVIGVHTEIIASRQIRPRPSRQVEPASPDVEPASTVVEPTSAVVEPASTDADKGVPEQLKIIQYQPRTLQAQAQPEPKPQPEPQPQPERQAQLEPEPERQPWPQLQPPRIKPTMARKLVFKDVQTRDNFIKK